MTTTYFIAHVAGNSYTVSKQHLDEQSNFPYSDSDFPPRGHIPASMRIIHPAEAMLLFLRNAKSFNKRDEFVLDDISQTQRNAEQCYFMPPPTCL